MSLLATREKEVFVFKIGETATLPEHKVSWPSEILNIIACFNVNITGATFPRRGVTLGEQGWKVYP